MWGGATTRDGLQASIKRLKSLDDVPGRPQEHNPDVQPRLSSQMSFTEEKQIASSLAFLSATVHDSSKVMAVCIEEHEDGQKNTIRIASNTGDLSKVVDDFKTMATILERAARRGTFVMLSLETKLKF